MSPKDALILRSYYEAPDSRNEHDGLIMHDGRLLLVECKSSDMVEPSRDPRRAFERAAQHFKSNRGIQHGCDQAQSVVTLLKNATRPVPFYDGCGNVVATLDSRDIKSAHVVCTTMESFGPLATNLTYLLKKEPAQAYPVALNLFDLETMVKGLRHCNKTWSDLLRYFGQRSATMGAVTADDELDLFGTYLKRGNLPFPVKNKVVVVASGSELFDDHYFEENGVQRSGTSSLSELAIRNAERMADRMTKLQTKRNPPKVGRNELCPCGSGTKYKKCHGR
jgi:hypothetical protein